MSVVGILKCTKTYMLGSLSHTHALMSMYVYTHTHTHTHTYACMNTYTRTHTHTHTCTHTCTHAHTCMARTHVARTHTQTHTHTHMDACTHTHTHGCIHTHTHTQQKPESPVVTLTWHASKYKVHKLHQRYILYCFSKGVPLVGVVYLIFTHMQGERVTSGRRRSLLLSLCDVFQALINSLVC